MTRKEDEELFRLVMNFARNVYCQEEIPGSEDIDTEFVDIREFVNKIIADAEGKNCPSSFRHS